MGTLTDFPLTSDEPITDSPFKQIEVKTAYRVSRSNNTGSTGTPYVELWDMEKQLICRFESGHSDHRQWMQTVNECLHCNFNSLAIDDNEELLPCLKVTFQRRITGAVDHPTGISKGPWRDAAQQDHATRRKGNFDVKALAAGKFLSGDKVDAIIRQYIVAAQTPDIDGAKAAIRAMDNATVEPNIEAATQVAQDYEAKMNAEQHAQEVADSAQAEADAYMPESAARRKAREKAEKSPDEWSVLKDPTNVNAGILIFNHFKREIEAVDRTLVVSLLIGAALHPDGDIPSFLHHHSAADCVARLQATIDMVRKGDNPVATKQTDAPAQNRWWLDEKSMKVFHAKLDARALSRGIAHDDVMAQAQAAVGVDFVGKFQGTGAEFIAAVMRAWDAADAAMDTADAELGEPIDEIEGGGDVDDRSDAPADPVPTMQVDAVIKSTGELVPLNRDANAAILHVKSSKALVDHMFSDKVLIPGVDYGKMPGAREDAKPSLYKPGAEKFLDAFQFYPVFKPTSNSVSNWQDDGFFNFEYECVVCDRVSGRIEGSGIGSCNSRESKYRYRWLYDNEAKAQGYDLTTMHSKNFPSKKGGTYTKYRVSNEDIFDLVNTLSKMAQKRALVAAVLNATGASAVFSQDMEDFADFGLVD